MECVRPVQAAVEVLVDIENSMPTSRRFNTPERRPEIQGFLNYYWIYLDYVTK